MQVRDRGFDGDVMGLLDLMPANISPSPISLAIKCMTEGGGGGVECTLGLMQRLWPSG